MPEKNQGHQRQSKGESVEKCDSVFCTERLQLHRYDKMQGLGLFQEKYAAIDNIIEG